MLKYPYGQSSQCLNPGVIDEPHGYYTNYRDQSDHIMEVRISGDFTSFGYSLVPWLSGQDMRGSFHGRGLWGLYRKCIQCVLRSDVIQDKNQDWGKVTWSSAEVQDNEERMGACVKWATWCKVFLCCGWHLRD